VPTTSKKQQKLMLAVAHSPKFAKKVGIPISVGKKMVIEDKKTGRLSDGGSVNRVGDAVMPSKRDPDIGKMIREVKVPTKMQAGGAAKASSGVSRLRRSRMC
jgi:hypothetical protein